jgi:hypothetical protein
MEIIVIVGMMRDLVCLLDHERIAPGFLAAVHALLRPERPQ